MHTVTLGGKNWRIEEPVFKILRQTIELYRQLADPNQPEDIQGQVVIAMMRLLIPDPRLFPSVWYKLRHFRTIKPFTGAEIADFLAAIPIICKLQTVTAAEATAKDPWGEIYAFYACCNGYTWDEIDNTMTLSRSELLQDYWLHNPPEHIIQKAKVGYQYKKLDTVGEFFRKNRPRQLH